MFECGIYKPSIDVGFSLSINNCLYIHIAFIFFYIQIDIEKENKEINAIRARRKANKGLNGSNQIINNTTSNNTNNNFNSGY